MAITKRVGDQSVMYRHGKLERIGPAGVLVPDAFTWRWQRAGDHAIELDIRVERGAAIVEAVRIERETSRPAISGDDLRRLPLTSLLERAVEVAAWMHAGGSWIAPPHGPTQTGQVAQAAKSAASRRRVTLDRLQEVADAYLEYGGSVDAISDELYVSRSQTYRLIEKAKKAGLIGGEVGR